VKGRQISAVVIGASAGGVEALLTLLPALERSCGVPVLVVVHLPRERPSRLVELFGPRCRVKVSEAEDKQPIEPGCVYFAPPDYHLLVDEGPTLSLSSDELLHFSRPSIDALFESAADAYRAGLLGIVLTGANADGAEGLAAVARAGGLTVVQTPRSANVATMPEAALKAAPGSSSLDLSQIAAVLRSIDGGRLTGEMPARSCE
jgi:two-component system chemotaxis response regulator CheB